ncbi:hypothetical protein PTKIN_Ptkin09bG0140800 [Pterospermum kingtungense]
MLKTKQPILQKFFIFSILLVALCSAVASSGAAKIMPSPSPEATALLGFQSKADLRNHLGFSQNASFRFCDWQGVTCYQQKVVRLIIEDLDLGGTFAPNTLSHLDQLRVLSLQNNSLTGSIPDLSGLINLKSLFLDHNFFTGSFPLSILSLHRLRTLDFSYNNLTGPIPSSLPSLDRLYYLRLDCNRLNGSIPPLNQSSLKTFNISVNNLTGAIPVTPTLLRFGFSSFSWNPGLCGEIIHKECHPRPHFFGPTAAVAAAPPTVGLGQSAQVHGDRVELGQPSSKKHKRTAIIIGFSTGVFVLIGSLLCFVMAVRKQKHQKQSTAVSESDEAAATAQEAAVIQMEQENELEEKVKRVQGMQVAKSGNLTFCAGEAQLYTLDQLMRASAELLGRGTMGTTYKAVLDNRLIVTVKRLDAVKLAGKPPSQHPVLAPDEMMHWLQSTREDDGGDDERLGMLLEVAIACSLSSPEQRPTMWQVIKMLQQIKEAVLMEEGVLDPQSGVS